MGPACIPRHRAPGFVHLNWGDATCLNLITDFSSSSVGFGLDAAPKVPSIRLVLPTALAAHATVVLRLRKMQESLTPVIEASPMEALPRMAGLQLTRA